MRVGRIILMVVMSILFMAVAAPLGGLLGRQYSPTDGSGVPIGIAAGLFIGHIISICTFIFCECVYKKCVWCYGKVSDSDAEGGCCGDSDAQGGCCGDKQEEGEAKEMLQRQMQMRTETPSGQEATAKC